MLWHFWLGDRESIRPVKISHFSYPQSLGDPALKCNAFQKIDRLNKKNESGGSSSGGSSSGGGGGGGGGGGISSNSSGSSIVACPRVVYSLAVSQNYWSYSHPDIEKTAVDFWSKTSNVKLTVSVFGTCSGETNPNPNPNPNPKNKRKQNDTWIKFNIELYLKVKFVGQAVGS